MDNMKSCNSAMELIYEKEKEDHRIYDELCLKQKKEQEKNRRYLESKKFNEESLKCNRLALQKADTSNKIAILSLIISLLTVIFSIFIKK